MNLLAFDTSTEYLSLAIQKGDDVLTFDALAGQSHSAWILPQIQALLERANLTLQDLDGIAFGAGPGSFTGVRIAAGVAQGLALGANLPVLGVCTLLALAEASQADRVITCLDARMGEVYHAAYIKVADAWQEVHAPSVCKPESVPAVSGADWLGVGSGWQTYPEQLSLAYATQLLNNCPTLVPSATAILQLARPLFKAGQAHLASEAMPIYVRNRVALTTLERETAALEKLALQKAAAI